LLNFLLWTSAALSAQIYPVSEWLAPADHRALEAAEIGWSGSIYRIVYVGRGETTGNWSRRITTWSAPSDLLGGGPLAARAGNIQATIMADCPGARSGALRSFAWSGRPAAEFWVACELYPETGRPDHYLVRLISREEHLLSAAITFRAAPTTAQIAAARTYLDTLILCTERSELPPCRSVPAPPRTVAD
jgi:hypothetical protein